VDKLEYIYFAFLVNLSDETMLHNWTFS